MKACDKIDTGHGFNVLHIQRYSVQETFYSSLESCVKLQFQMFWSRLQISETLNDLDLLQ